MSYEMDATYSSMPMAPPSTSSPLRKLVYQIHLSYFRMTLTFGLYMLTPVESFLLTILVTSLFSLLAYLVLPLANILARSGLDLLSTIAQAAASLQPVVAAGDKADMLSLANGAGNASAPFLPAAGMIALES
jgi:hypothetical protein